MTNLCNSLPRLNQPSNLAISRAHSLVMSSTGRLSSSSSSSSAAVTAEGDYGDSQGQQQQLHNINSHSSIMVGPIKSARYRPPGFQPVKSKRIDDHHDDGGPNTPTATQLLSQSTPVLTQDPGNLKVYILFEFTTTVALL